MHLDLKKLNPGAVIETDLCIIGAGIAGIAIARRFLGTGTNVVLLESGGLDHEADIQELADGENLGFDYYPLIDSRLRLFGGTTAIWGGRVAMLDEIDFQQRDWVPHSGWPLSRQTLDPWYEHARAALDLSAHDLDERLFARLGLSPPPFDPRSIRVAFWQFDTVIGRYTAERCADLWRAPNIHVLTHASATGLKSSANGRGIEQVEIAEPDGRRATVKARQFVLAAGGIENARLLLASNDVHPRGLGNDRDLVGRFFMEHPHARGGRIRFEQPWRMLKLLIARHRLSGTEVAACLRPGEALQQQAGILNTSFAIGCRQHPEQKMQLATRAYQAVKHRLAPTRTNRALWQSMKRALRWLRERSDPLRPWLLDRLDRRGIYAVVRAEQAPNPDSRVCLSGDRDALGVPRAALDWQLSELDKRSVLVTMEAFDRELRRLDLGRVELPDWLCDAGRPWQIDPLVSGHPIGGYHHMGTTRMAADPGRGVVDADGRVFGVDNLHVAGSSVFPTSGWANPTLTILALSLRLAERLSQRLEADAAPIELGRRVA